METNKVKALELARELGAHLKIVTSFKSFDNYNSFFNIFDSSEEYCRRILVFTKDNTLEEVEDNFPDKPITKAKIVNKDIWIKDYPLITDPKNIDLQEVYLEDLNLIDKWKELNK